jgi:signal transduction histidine kinase
MSVDLAEHALNPFFTSKADLGHDGLGLSVAYGVVCQSGGYLEIGGKIGDGTRVDLYFPRATASAAGLDTTVHLVPPRRRTHGQTN